MDKESINQNPLSSEDTYSGKIYPLGSPTGGNIDLKWLREQLDERIIQTDVNEQFEKREDLHIPEVFQSDSSGEIDIASIKDVQYAESDALRCITGQIVLDDPSTITFRDKKVLILETLSAQFVIGEHESLHFLSIFGERRIVNNISDIISDDINNLGFSLNDEMSIGHVGFIEIANDLVDNLLNTTFSDYPQPSLDKKRYLGRGYQDEPEYKEETRRGNVHGHRFTTSKLDGKETTIEISDDGLVRSYTKITLEAYLHLITEYILPNVNRPVQSSAHSFSTEGSKASGENKDSN